MTRQRCYGPARRAFAQSPRLNGSRNRKTPANYLALFDRRIPVTAKRQQVQTGSDFRHPRAQVDDAMCQVRCGLQIGKLSHYLLEGSGPCGRFIVLDDRVPGPTVNRKPVCKRHRDRHPAPAAVAFDPANIGVFNRLARQDRQRPRDRCSGPVRRYLRSPGCLLREAESRSGSTDFSGRSRPRHTPMRVHRRQPIGAGRFALRSYGCAIVPFLLSIRRVGERFGRISQRLETREKANEIQSRMLEAAARRPRNRDELVDRLRDGGF